MIDFPQSFSYNESQVGINITATDPSSVHTVLAEIDNTDNITLVNFGGDLYFNDTYAFSEGAHTIIIFANDTLGNMNTTASISFTIDTITPSVVINYPANGSIWSAESMIKVTVSDSNLDTLWYEVNGIKIELTNNTEELFDSGIWTSLPDGPFVINVYANDTAGNINNTLSITMIKRIITDGGGGGAIPGFDNIIIFSVFISSTLLILIKKLKKNKELAN